jgi:hypothetical protein
MRWSDLSRGTRWGIILALLYCLFTGIVLFVGLEESTLFLGVLVFELNPLYRVVDFFFPYKTIFPLLFLSGIIFYLVVGKIFDWIFTGFIKK